MQRKAFEWDCVLQSEEGQTIQRRIRAFWSPEKENITNESIAQTAAAMEFVNAGKTTRFAGISAQLVS